MSLHRPTSYRRPASSFIHDDNEVNLIQLSPHKDSTHYGQRHLFEKESDYDDSKTNFAYISDTALNTQDKTRAVFVTKTGEKHLLDLDVAPVHKSNTNTFSMHSPRYHPHTMDKISEKQSQISLSENKACNKSSKKVKAPLKRNVNPKHRIVFTPRNCDSPKLSQQLPMKKSNQDKSNFIDMKTNTKKNPINTETQTDSFNYFSSSPSMNYIPMEGPTKYFMPNSNRQHQLYRTPVAPPLKPLRIYTKSNPNLGRYNELRNIASILTLITVFSWLFSTFFDLDCLLSGVSEFWQYLQGYFFKKERPKTKVEILVDFLKDLIE